ncbi:hypothetical protein C8Q77DRAFT_1214487 [Trametes polyzona]|nr:hypothetical protein C8Q77DRAFT_1214487 [Trametes polyzona]
MPAFTSPAALRRLSRTGSLRATAASTTVPPVDTPTATTTTTTLLDCEVTTSASAPTSPLLPVENESIVLKAVRAYERDRQRAKKTKERSERERQRTTAAAADPTNCRHCRDGSGTARRGARAGAGTKGDMAAGVLTPPGPGTPFVEEVIADVVERETLARGALEVHLAQLVKPAKARRSKELDEPWEHISADELDEKRAELPSYATVVASTI